MSTSKFHWTIRSVDPSDYRETLFNLYRIVLGNTTATIDQFIWKYEDSPLGRMKVWSAWDIDSEDMVAAFSAYRRQFIHNGQIVTVYQLADAMVCQRCRGRGIFSALVQRISEDLTAEAAIFHFGYANNLSAPILRRFPISSEVYHSRVFVYLNGSREACSTLFPSRPVLARRIERIASPVIRFSNRLRGHCRNQGTFLEPLTFFDDLPEKWSFEMASYHQFSPFRSKAFLHWRAIDVPGCLKADLLNYWCVYCNRRIGYFVLYRDRKRNILKLIDHLCERPKHNLVRCFKALRDFAIRNDYDAITTNIASPIIQRALSRVGFFNIKPVRCILFLLDRNLTKQTTLEKNFFMQFPIDRDVIDY